MEQLPNYSWKSNRKRKKHIWVRKVSTWQGNGYTTGCLLDYVYFRDNYRLTPVGLGKEKALDADLRTIQQIVFQGVVGGAGSTEIRLYSILEKTKGTVLELYNGTAKVL